MGTTRSRMPLVTAIVGVSPDRDRVPCPTPLLAIAVHPTVALTPRQPDGNTDTRRVLVGAIIKRGTGTGTEVETIVPPARVAVAVQELPAQITVATVPHDTANTRLMIATVALHLPETPGTATGPPLAWPLLLRVSSPTQLPQACPALMKPQLLIARLVWLL